MQCFGWANQLCVDSTWFKCVCVCVCVDKGHTVRFNGAYRPAILHQNIHADCMIDNRPHQTYNNNQCLNGHSFIHSLQCWHRIEYAFEYAMKSDDNGDVNHN